MKKFTCLYSKLFNFCKIFKLSAISFVIAAVFLFSSYAFAGTNTMEGDPEGVTGGWSVGSPESSQPIETYIMACTTPGIPASASVSNIGTTTVTANWGASTCVGCSLTYYWSVGTSSTHTYTSGYTARGTTTGLSASVTGLTCGTTYYLRVYAYNSCGVSGGIRTSSAFTTSGNPTAPTSAAVSPSSACSGTSTIYTLTYSGGGAGSSGGTLRWYEGGCGSGSSIGSGNSVTITRSLTSNTTYYCRWESNSCGNSGCASATVTVNSNPTAPSSVSVSPTSVCYNTSTNLTLTYTGGSAGGSGGKFYWYEGSCGGTYVASTNNQVITKTLTSNTTYYGRWESNSCGNSGCASATVTVNSNPTAPTSAAVSPSSACSGTSTTFTLTYSGGGAGGSGGTLRWYEGGCGSGSSIGSGNSVTITRSLTSNTTYYCRWESNSCGNSGCASATVTVNSNPTAPTSAAVSPSSACSGTSTTYTLTYSGGGAGGSGGTLRWYEGGCGSGSSIGSGNSVTITRSLTSNTTYYCRWESNSCGNSGCASATVTVISNPTAPTSVSVSPSTICSGTSTDYTLTYTGGDAGGSGGKFYWYEGSCGGTPVASTNNQVITRTLTSSTTYYGRWESSSCGNSACKGATVTVDLTAPTYDGYSNVGGYTYYDGTNYWVKGGNKLTIDIKHSDNVDVKTQYLTFCHDNCTPNGCGDAPHEIKSYNTDGSFTDWMANDSYLNITGTSIVAGGWGNTTITNRWTTEVSASCPDWDWYPYTYLHDWCSNGVGYTALGKWIRVDNTAPTRDVASVNDACWITNGTNEYTITIVSTEPRSGFGGPYGMMALVNYYSGETDAGGYFAWHPSSYVHTENQMACSGGGYVSKSSSWGGARIDLVSATTSTIGNQRTVTFTVRPHSDYLELNGTNKICMYTSDNCSNEAGWTEFATNFTSIRVPATPTGATEICTGGSATLTRGNAPPSGVTYYWQTSSTGESTTLGSGETLVDSPGSTTTYYVRPYSSSGCWGQASAGVTVTVSADPTAPSLNVATPASGNTVCVGATVSATFNAGSGGVDCGDEYQYTNGGSWSSYTPGTEITASTTGTNVIQIQTRRVCSGNGCDGAGGTWATKAQWTVVADPDVSASGATTICSGLTADLTSSGSNGTGTMSYQWQYYDGATWVNTGTNSNELTTQALAGTTDFRCQYSATGLGCTTATSNTVTVTVSTPEPEGLQLGEDDYVWTGAIDTKWDDADNWISYNGSTFSIPGNVPAVTNDVFFTTYGTTCGTSTPEISSATGNCKDITIESGHELKMLSAQILNVQGNWKNNGTFTAGNGTVTFNGAAQQTVYAGTSNFHNLTINNSSGIEMTSDLTVGNVLNMTLGNIDAKTNDKVLILGTATDNLGTLEYTNGYVLGNMKRWFSNTTNSDTASGLFPLGVGINNRHLLVEYTDASSGGSLTAFFNEASMGWPETWMDIDNVPIIPAAGDCPAFIIMTLSDEGYWDITPSTPSDMTGGKYNISLTGGGIQTINNLCNLTALKREGGGEWYEDGDHVQPTGSTSAPIVKRVGASGWSNWGMGGGAYNPLPINLLSFNAACQNREVTINWTTATETNNDYFTIERSIDAQKWNVLTQIEGAGNSNAIKYYTVRDDNPYDGISYYRLKQTDYNGQYEYFNPVSVRCDSEESTPIISYYPNPFTSEVVIDIHNLSATKASLVIYDLLGNKVYENIFSMVEEINKKFTIDLNRLPVGVYIASFVTDEYSIVSRIVKQF